MPPKKLIIGISLAVVLVAAAVFAVVLARSRALQEETSPVTGANETGTSSSGGNGGLSSSTTGGSTAPPTVPQGGPCGDGVCSEGEAWCAPDCGTEEQRFEGSIVATEAAPTSITIGWKTSKPSTGEVSYGLTDRYELGTVKSVTLSTSHEARLTGLAPGAVYIVRVRATDEDGKLWESAGLAFETPGR